MKEAEAIRLALLEQRVSLGHIHGDVMIGSIKVPRERVLALL